MTSCSPLLACFRFMALRLNLRRIATYSVVAALGVLSWGSSNAVTPTATATTLAARAGGSVVSSVVSGTVVTLSATVLAGSTPVTTGQVKFCDTAGISCVDSYLLGTAQLTSTGTASLRLRTGIGAHTYKAVFTGTAASITSASPVVAVQVTGTHSTVTTLTQTGVAGNYTLAATVAGTGSSVAPTGSVSLVDTTNNNALLGTGVLGSATSAQTFASHVTYATGDSPIASVTADFNNDGFPDIAMANYRGSSVGVFLGNGDGTIGVQVTYGTGASPSYVAAGDFNADGIVDLAVANSVSNTVSVLLGKGDGTFFTQVTYAAGNSPVFVTTADLDSDGVLDLVVSNSLDNSVGVFLGKGDGTFNTQVVVPSGLTPLSIAVADFNADGIPDLAVTNYIANRVGVVIGKGGGVFNSPVSYSVGTGPTPLVAGDFNRDGIVDLAVTNYTANTLSVLTGKGDGTFNAQVVYATGTSPYAIAPADYNGDGILDLAVANYVSDNVGVFVGRADGTFAAQVTYATGSGPSPVSTADFNGDGIADLVTGNYHGNNLSVLLGQLSSTATATATGISPVGAVTSAHLVKATYTGDSLYTGSSSNTVSLTSQPIVTVLTLSVTPAISAYGQQVVLSAVLNPSVAQTLSTNGEVVSFFNGSQALGTGVLTNGSATLNLTTLPVGVSAITARYAGNSNFLASTTASVPHTVSQPGASLSLAAQTLPVGTASATLAAQLTYTGTVAPTAPVSFTVDNGAAVTAVCTGVASPLTCTASYAINSLLAGAHTITASQPAAGAYAAASATAALTLTVSDFAFNATGNTVQTVTGGSAATFTFALSPGSPVYPGGVSFAVAGLDAGMSYTLTPTSVATTAGPQTVSLTVQTVKLTSQADTSPAWSRRSGLALAVLFLPFCLVHRRRVNARLLMLLGCGFLFMTAMTGCGSNTVVTTTTPVNRTITVTATAAGYATPHSASVTLKVQ
ncbi:FG-GAP repeat protein [Terriglobus roseus DSM 18391]|uniref:FG-GAP repeat protein n=2 Tax=Terriglobus roseus TaxID=392734 RepID=I3ZHQ3_TERRK|nr:FG-GAP repeat protein [Terriglobus roseus DSM 18391]AFL88771.1 FG-GAP repeat protein [Terriglobus roseus DSM 18391]